jgi:hypothetical protein
MLLLLKEQNAGSGIFPFMPELLILLTTKSFSCTTIHIGSMALHNLNPARLILVGLIPCFYRVVFSSFVV